MAKANLKKVVKAENKNRKSNALNSGLNRAAEAGAGTGKSSKRALGYYVSRDNGANIPPNETRVVKKREAKPYVKAEKKAAKAAVRQAAYRTVATKKLNAKKAVEAAANDKSGKKPTMAERIEGGTFATRESSKSFSRDMRAAGSRITATKRSVGAGMSDKKINKIAKKATKAATKRAR
jgi:hypothetical protein